MLIAFEVIVMNIQDSLFQRWQECWRDHTQRDLGDSLESHPEEKLFLDVFKESYQDSVKKSEKNRINNFKFKGWFLNLLKMWICFQLLLFIGAVCAALKMPFLHNTSLSDFVTLSMLLFILFATALLAINKWLNIKKFQETWARHTYTMYQYQQLMLCYLDRLTFSDGSSFETREAFKLCAIHIMEKNIEKFSKNMEEKERNLMEDLFSLKQ